MSQYDFDLFVIGAGSGGVRASRIAANLGARVAVAEDRYMGGTCVNVGCVPKKLYVYASEYSESHVDSQGFGWEKAESTFNWSHLRDNKTKEISRLNGIYENLLGSNDVTVFNGRATISSPNSVTVNGKTISAERILIATGGWPYVPEFPGDEHVVTSNDIFDLPDFPQRIVVVGGGYIAVEFAGIFNGLGADTKLLYRGDQILRGFDEEVRNFTAEEITKKGVELHLNTNIEQVERLADGSLKATLIDGQTLVADTILYATGRTANLEGLGLENSKAEVNQKGQVVVDNNFQTQEPSIYALGDVIGGMELTPVALKEGMALARHLYGSADPKNLQPIEIDYDNIPTAVFCQPNIATVGLTEAQAREAYDDIDVYCSSFRALKNAVSGSEEKTFMKLLVDKKSDKVVGVHMVGKDSGEIIQGIAIALKAGATKAIFDSTIGIHPTAAEEFVTMRSPTR
jgi:glutathione reductase (NADPH)